MCVCMWRRCEAHLSGIDDVFAPAQRTYTKPRIRVRELLPTLGRRTPPQHALQRRFGLPFLRIPAVVRVCVDASEADPGLVLMPGHELRQRVRGRNLSTIPTHPSKKHVPTHPGKTLLSVWEMRSYPYLQKLVVVEEEDALGHEAGAVEAVVDEEHLVVVPSRVI